ncbi:uncharacterized protein [Prorops nasuta]|uniref:uncharacterized protein n=1 Tax=Prorops nasuta TaxID=863751 RepID=UPI0034CE6E10
MMLGLKKTFQFILKPMDKEVSEDISITTDTCICGRRSSNQIVCRGSKVSQKHCIFICDKYDLYVIDLGSSNGVYINGKRQISHCMVKLNNNDIIGIGSPRVKNFDPDTSVYKLCISELIDNDIKEIKEIPNTFKIKEDAVKNKMKRRLFGQLPENLTVSKISKSDVQEDVHTSLDLIKKITHSKVSLRVIIRKLRLFLWRLLQKIIHPKMSFSALIQKMCLSL